MKRKFLAIMLVTLTFLMSSNKAMATPSDPLNNGGFESSLAGPHDGSDNNWDCFISFDDCVHTQRSPYDPYEGNYQLLMMQRGDVRQFVNYDFSSFVKIHFYMKLTYYSPGANDVVLVKITQGNEVVNLDILPTANAHFGQWVLYTISKSLIYSSTGITSNIKAIEFLIGADAITIHFDAVTFYYQVSSPCPNPSIC